uniref:Uncharacterized protein n=1 Tax=Anguilla anguilla TaxID=7936 RepID=A0A0E9QBA1_ANGAN
MYQCETLFSSQCIQHAYLGILNILFFFCSGNKVNYGIQVTLS